MGGSSSVPPLAVLLGGSTLGRRGQASGAPPGTLHTSPAHWLLATVLERKARGVSLVLCPSSPALGPCPLVQP